ncbi:hypothetical protein EGR_09703 [Echinococcus granulosus]|uniref:Uncharacterized protein n=1 Tax=Echinococcus granulosus TaxID=6210 RepID=W6U304_ECHGR|nr:hypothetical protein EGR_09703 [Echinococcus granulosus]EUB55458.1 hypothetical protein EGR_09703 [Echinococcus granulosus]
MEKGMKEGEGQEQPTRKADSKSNRCKRKREDFLEIISKIARQIYEQIAEFFEKWLPKAEEEEQPIDERDGKKPGDGEENSGEGKGETQDNKEEEETFKGERDKLLGEEGGETSDEMEKGKKPDDEEDEESRDGGKGKEDDKEEEHGEKGNVKKSRK